MNMNIEWPPSAGAHARAIRERRARSSFIVALVFALAVIACVVFQFRQIAPYPAAFVRLVFLVSATLCLLGAAAWNRLSMTLDFRRRTDQARGKAAVRDAIVSRASFDIRSALMAIIGYCDLPLEDKSRPQERFDSIRRQASLIIAAVDGILDTPDTTRPGALSLAPAGAPAAANLPMSVLLAEDDPHLRTLIHFYLQSSGAEVTSVANGKMACEEAMLACKNQKPFDVVLMDVQMPEFDGLEATIKLRSAGYPHPIIALTANVTDQEERRCMAAGCNAFLAKPVDRQELARILRRFMPVSARCAAEEAVEAPLSTQIAAVRESFRGDIPRRIADIASVILAGDLPRVSALAHRLKGTAGCYGFTGLCDAAGALQDAADRSDSDEIIERCLQELNKHGRPAIPASAA